MSFISKAVFFIFLSAVFLLEGLGLWDRQIALFGVYLMPFFLFLALIFEKKPIAFPKKISFLFFAFLFFSLLSLFFSINVERSFYFFIYYLALFLIFIFTYNFKEQLIKDVVRVTFFLTFVFIVYSFFLLHPLSKNYQFLIPQRDYQFVYQVYPTHHPLGIFIIIPLLMNLVFLIKKGGRIAFFTFIFLFSVLLFSFFRTSYIAFIAVTGAFVFLNRERLKNWPFPKSLLLAISLFLPFIFLFSVVIDKESVFFLSSIQQFLKTHFNLGYKTFFSGRDQFWLALIKGFAERPFTGFGLANFWNLSVRFADTPNTFADSANFFFDFFAEIGFFGGIILLLIIIKIFLAGLKGLRNDNLLQQMIFFCFFGLIIFFQAGPGKHYSLILFFFILGGLIYEENEKFLKANRFFGLLSFIPLFILESAVVSQFYLLSGDYLLALYRFPFQKSLFPPAVEQLEKKGDISQKKFILGLYERLFSGEVDVLNYLSNVYEKEGNKKKALFYYEKSFNWWPFQSFFIVKKVFQLKKELSDEEGAFQFLKRFLSKYYYWHYHYYWSYFDNEIRKFCQENEGVCQLF